jgi:integrase/recombinase XerD
VPAALPRGRHYPNPMKTRALTVPEARRILDEIGAPYYGHNAGTHAILFRFLFYTGARISEALAVRVSDVAPDGSAVVIRTLKGGPARAIPVAPDLRVSLRRAVVQSQPTRSDPLAIVFPVNERTFRSALARAAVRAGVPGRVSPHTLRHTFATLAHQAGASSRTVQALLGHRTIRSTETYLHTDPRDIDRAVHALPRIV